jgi:hypothetical protein
MDRLAGVSAASETTAAQSAFGQKSFNTVRLTTVQHCSTLFNTVQHGYTGPPGRAARGMAGKDPQTQVAGARGGLCLWIFACHDGGRRPPPGGLQYGVEHCGVIRGIREIRGYDQPVSRSPSSRTFSSAGSSRTAEKRISGMANGKWKMVERQ